MFIPYGKQTIKQNDIDEVNKVLVSPYITTGPKAQEFEKELCKYTGARYSIVVSNGTAALHLASLVLLKKGDIVLTTPNSFLATSNAILYVGAKPLFVDICEDGNIDLDLCEQELVKNPNIKAIYVVSFSGKIVKQQKLKELKQKYGLTILEDNAHAIGAVSSGIKAGSCQNSDISIFSFHPVKHITTGEGGAITTNSKDIYERIISLRSHGVVKTSDMAPWEYEMRALGYNYRLTDFQSALGISQLKKLDEFLGKRRTIAKLYHNSFRNSFIKPLYEFDEDSAYHLFVVRVKIEDKKELYKKLISKGVGVQLHYIPINKQPYYKSLGYGEEKTPMMDRYYKEALSLPIYPILSIKEQMYVIDTLIEVINESS